MKYKYKVTLKISYVETAFMFDDRQEALDFMEIAWTHRADDKDTITKAVMTFVEEEEQ